MQSDTRSDPKLKGNPIGEKLKRVAREIREDLEHPAHKISHDDHSEAHKIFRSKPGHASSATIGGLTAQQEQEAIKGEQETPLPGIVSPGSTGVVYVMDRAMANGFNYDDPEWANLGQGAPEVGEIPGGNERPQLDLKGMGVGVNEYAPTAGIRELREAVANLYNVTYRKEKDSKYTHENVCIVPGGRAGLSRLASVIGDVYVAYQVPEYTSYSQMLSVFRRLVPVASVLKKGDFYKMNVDHLEEEIKDMGISVTILSNPRNPTGQVIEGDELRRLVYLSRRGTTVILDEFYSWYQYEHEPGWSSSAAGYVEDVNDDPVVLVNGLTKCWRLPGWRIAWVVGPKQVISALSDRFLTEALPTRTYVHITFQKPYSFLTSPSSLHINESFQVAATQLLSPSLVQTDMVALQKHFKHKRDVVLERLERMGLAVDVAPVSTFYVWLNLGELPPPLNSGLVLFEELLKEKVIVVPGIMFDINPSHRRNLFDSPAHTFIRISFGPPLEEVERGLDGLERVLDRAYEHIEQGRHLHEHFGRDLVRDPIGFVLGSKTGDAKNG